MKKRNMFIRIFAIVLCLIMVLGVIVVGISTLANGEEVVSVVSAVADTGSNDKPMVIIAAIAVVAVAAAAACVISSGKNKKTVADKIEKE